MIKISELIFDYPGHRALDRISLTIEKGSVTALVGSNGAGKTTLMRCIAGLDTPLSGSITVAGLNVIEQPREVHRVMGYLSDFFGLYQELTVARCLEYAAAAQGMPEQEIAQAVLTTAGQLGLSDRLQQVSGTLSRGLRQRVAIGQAIIHSPQMLLLDEPASGLDPEARAQLAALFRQLNANGMTILVSSHILAELDEYSTHMLALREGRLLEYRSLAENGDILQKRQMHIGLARADGRLRDLLALQAGVTLKSSDALNAAFDFGGDQAAQATLLAELINAGLAVASFSEQKENLQQSYLRTVESHTGGGA
jgi:ABC-2 type transport system ATP-binding protein